MNNHHQEKHHYEFNFDFDQYFQFDKYYQFDQSNQSDYHANNYFYDKSEETAKLQLKRERNRIASNKSRYIKYRNGNMFVMIN